MEQFCLDCGMALKGRTDKKFCDDQCRSNHNNQLRSINQSFVKQVNQVLSKNRSILKAQNPERTAKIKRDFLLQKGFNFEFYTHIYTTQKGNTYFFCYEYGYLILNEEDFLLVKKIER